MSLTFKNLLLKRAILLATAIICFSVCVRAQEPQPGIKVSYPSFKVSVKDSGKKSSKKNPASDKKITLIAVELNDTTTVLTLEYACPLTSKSKEGSSCHINNDSFLVTIEDGAYTYYDFLDAEGIAIGPEKTEVPRGESIIFKLIFKPLPEGTKTFNLCEPGGWNLAEVDLSSSNSPESQQVGTFDVEEYMVRPTFLGGDVNGVSDWVNKGLVYPEIYQRNNLEETIQLKLTVEKDGSVHSSLLKGHNKLFIDEALRVAGMLPPMTPGTIYGRPCIISYTFPIVFRLQTQ